MNATRMDEYVKKGEGSFAEIGTKQLPRTVQHAEDQAVAYFRHDLMKGGKTEVGGGRTFNEPFSQWYTYRDIRGKQGTGQATTTLPGYPRVF